MKVRCLQSAYINSIYRKGPEYHDNGDVLAVGDTFEVADDFVVNREVLEVVEGPANGKAVVYADAKKAVASR